MTRIILTVAGAALLAACGPAERPDQPAGPAPTPVQDAILSPTGYDGIRVGRPPAAATRHRLVDTGTADGVCRIFAADDLPGVAVTVEDGLVRRVTLRDGPSTPPAIRTDRGIGPGATEAAVRAAYRPVGERAHDVLPAPATNLFWGEEGVEETLRFEIGGDGRVIALHAGVSPWLGYSDGCS